MSKYLNNEVKTTRDKLIKELKYLQNDITREINYLENEDDYMPNKNGIIQDSKIDKLCWQLHFLMKLNKEV